MLFRSYNANGGAGIQYRGPFGTGNLTGGIVYLAVGFETIYPAATRDSIMSRILSYLSPGVGTIPEDHSQPRDFHLAAAYPNPFNGAITLPFTLNQERVVHLKIYNIRGQEIFSESRRFAAGSQQFRWNGKSTAGQAVASGIYWVIMRAGSRLEHEQITYLK